jgi:phage head maturation protease
VDATGLKYSYDSPKRSYANDLLDAIDQGDVSQLFCFQNQRAKWTEGDPLNGRQKNNSKVRKIYDVSQLLIQLMDTEMKRRTKTQ